MTEAPVPDSLQETSELTFMKSKFPLLKQKLSQPFPYFYALAPKDQSLYNDRLAQIKTIIKENPQLPDHKDIFQAIAFGKIQGMPATSHPLDVLTKYFEFENKQFWTQFTKQKIGQKFYGLPKQKSHCLWQIKDLELIKEVFNIQQAKKQRKIVKQYSNFYKAGCKFVQKFEKIKNQNDVAEAYEQYKKVEQEDSKMNKILTSQKNKSTKIVAQVPIQPIQKPQKVEEKEKESQQKKVEVMQQELNKPSTNIPEVKIPEQKILEEKPSKKKTEPKQQPSNKKQNKVANDKQHQLLSQHKPLDFFFKKKAKEPQQTAQDTEMKDEQKIDKTDAFIASLGFKKESCETTDNLKEQFKNFKKKMDEEIKICYVTINMLRSRLELQNFPVKDVKVDFLDPFGEKENIRYDDSSDEYSELIADSINQEMVQEEEEEQQEESNSAIVSDSFCEYKSSHIMSSSQSEDEEQEIKPKPEITKSVGKWFFSLKDIEKREKYAKYDMMCLEDALPIIVKDQVEEANNDVTSAHKVEMYRQIHGSYTPKEVLIKKLNTIVENKISMNKLSTMIKDICEKKGSQRVLKPEIIRQLAEELAQLHPNLEAELEQIRNERETTRNIETEAKRQEKMNEKDQKIEKLILEYEGQISTSLLLEYLRSKQVKILKQQLNSIIKTKQGEKWEEIRNEIKKNKLIKKSRTKAVKVKPPKPAKNENEENLMNTHRPIDEILRQNQIDNMNKPKKEKKPSENEEMVNQADQMISQQEEYVDPEDDESFELNNKRKKNKKQSKNKRIVKISPLLPPVKRNPRRNKKKSKKYNQQEEVEGKANQKNQQIQQENENGEPKDEENVEKQEGQNVDGQMVAEESNVQAQNRREQTKQNRQTPSKEVEKQKALVSSVQEKNASPVRILEVQKKEGEEIEKTANKVGISEHGVESG